MRDIKIFSIYTCFNIIVSYLHSDHSDRDEKRDDANIDEAPNSVDNQPVESAYPLTNQQVSAHQADAEMPSEVNQPVQTFPTWQDTLGATAKHEGAVKQQADRELYLLSKRVKRLENIISQKYAMDPSFPPQELLWPDFPLHRVLDHDPVHATLHLTLKKCVRKKANTGRSRNARRKLPMTAS